MQISMMRFINCVQLVARHRFFYNFFTVYWKPFIQCNKIKFSVCFFCTRTILRLGDKTYAPFWPQKSTYENIFCPRCTSSYLTLLVTKISQIYWDIPITRNFLSIVVSIEIQSKFVQFSCYLFCTYGYLSMKSVHIKMQWNRSVVYRLTTLSNFSHLHASVIVYCANKEL